MLWPLGDHWAAGSAYWEGVSAAPVAKWGAANLALWMPCGLCRPFALSRSPSRLETRHAGARCHIPEVSADPRAGGFNLDPLSWDAWEASCHYAASSRTALLCTYSSLLTPAQYGQVPTVQPRRGPAFCPLVHESGVEPILPSNPLDAMLARSCSAASLPRPQLTYRARPCPRGGGPGAWETGHRM